MRRRVAEVSSPVKQPEPTFTDSGVPRPGCHVDSITDLNLSSSKNWRS